jgi:hypothetical protein
MPNDKAKKNQIRKKGRENKTEPIQVNLTNPPPAIWDHD